MLIAAILAAGRSARMGVDKLFLPLGDDPVLLHVVRAVRGANPDEIWIVTRPENAERTQGMAAAENCRIVLNDRADEGIGTSISRAAAVASPAIEGLIVAQGDQPLVPPRVFASLVDRFRTKRPPFVACRYGDVITTPVIFDPTLLDELRALGGDRGARPILGRHAAHGEILEVAEEAGLDVDDADGYRRISRVFARLASARLKQ